MKENVSVSIPQRVGQQYGRKWWPCCDEERRSLLSLCLQNPPKGSKMEFSIQCPLLALMQMLPFYIKVRGWPKMSIIPTYTRVWKLRVWVWKPQGAPHSWLWSCELTVKAGLRKWFSTILVQDPENITGMGCSTLGKDTELHLVG